MWTFCFQSFASQRAINYLVKSNIHACKGFCNKKKWIFKRFQEVYVFAILINIARMTAKEIIPIYTLCLQEMSCQCSILSNVLVFANLIDKNDMSIILICTFLMSKIAHLFICFRAFCTLYLWVSRSFPLTILFSSFFSYWFVSRAPSLLGKLSLCMEYL